MIAVNGLELNVTAADGRPGCNNGEKQRNWTVKGRMSLASYIEAIIDFRPRGGDENTLLRWDGSGIRFPSGNKWTKIADIADE